YRVATITLPSDRPVPAPSGSRVGVASSGENAQDPVFGNFFSSQFERDQAHRDRETLERVLRQMGDSGLSAEALAVVGSVQQNADLAAALKELNSKQADLRTLRYRYSDQYSPVQTRFEEAGLAEASTVPDVRILDHAVVPQRPVRNTAPRVIMLGFVASLGLGLFGAVVLDRIDPRVRYPDQVSREMGLAILGAVPHLRTLPHAGRHGRGRVPEDVNQVVEALRGVCLNLVYAHGGRAPLLVTVTSPGAGDGKSFLAANLAHTFADGEI